MVVRMRHTRAHTANRRSHHALKALNLIACPNCDARIRAHMVCDVCGFYKGKKVKSVKSNNEKSVAIQK
jgi:large subunit ribosomal protein L32